MYYGNVHEEVKEDPEVCESHFCVGAEEESKVACCLNNIKVSSA